MEFQVQWCFSERGPVSLEVRGRSLCNKTREQYNFGNADISWVLLRFFVQYFAACLVEYFSTLDDLKKKFRAAQQENPNTSGDHSDRKASPRIPG